MVKMLEQKSSTFYLLLLRNSISPLRQFSTNGDPMPNALMAFMVIWYLWKWRHAIMEVFWPLYSLSYVCYHYTMDPYAVLIIIIKICPVKPPSRSVRTCSSNNVLLWHFYYFAISYFQTDSKTIQLYNLVSASNGFLEVGNLRNIWKKEKGLSTQFECTHFSNDINSYN